MDTKIEIFDGKTFSGLMEDIYNNVSSRQSQVKKLISELKPLINSTGDAALIVPLIAEYLEIGVKSEDQLVRLATIVQRIISSEAKSVGDTSGLALTEEEKNQLLQELESVVDDTNGSVVIDGTQAFGVKK